MITTRLGDGQDHDDMYIRALLRENATAVADPGILQRLLFLRQLSRTWDRGELADEDARFGNVDAQRLDTGGAPPPGTRKVALGALQDLVGALVQGFLPGWTIHAPRDTRPAQRPRVDVEEELELLWAFNGLMERLAALRRRAPLRFVSKKDREGSIESVAAIVQEIHPDKYGTFEVQQRPLTPEDARRIATAAVGKNGRVQDRRLVYGLLAHYTGLRPTQVRGRVETAEATYPDQRFVAVRP